jgi:hypothetical protein
MQAASGEKVITIKKIIFKEDWMWATTTFFKEIYCKERMYSMFKDKLPNCSINQTEDIFIQWHKWNRSEYK